MALVRIAGIPGYPDSGSTALVIAVAARPWTSRALCTQTDPELFFSDSADRTRQAKKLCSRCPVRAECLSQALDGREEHGVWGGLDRDERRRLLRRTAARSQNTVTS